ncbi:hypothetical protein CYLTODRAFT_427295 [Cylindrobasidium torrendii FP15055 ss-10]|uniref:Uncharacterized protein n=1 Tax=Cylindrobasidium torrendii FP15055 ss-10 TaxID=1314674 RepID=A0A0D7AU04_9AGAR|nr:hypothetical protein CYLTODRAFT_427295 [Cylindrobasidium torrendii FP15055 ss-10]
MVVAHNLECLSILRCFPRAETQVQDVLDKLTAPSLTGIDLVAQSSDGADSVDLFDSVLNMVERSKCPIRHLVYRSSCIFPAHITRLLQYTDATLEWLELKDHVCCDRGMVNALVDALTARNLDIPAPRLHYLSFSLPVTVDLDMGTHYRVDDFVEMVRSRQSVAPLRRLHIECKLEENNESLLDSVD